MSAQEIRIPDVVRRSVENAKGDVANLKSEGAKGVGNFGIDPFQLYKGKVLLDQHDEVVKQNGDQAAQKSKWSLGMPRDVPGVH